jgi:hypothetical protein
LFASVPFDVQELPLDGCFIAEISVVPEMSIYGKVRWGILILPLLSEESDIIQHYDTLIFLHDSLNAILFTIILLLSRKS